MAQHTTRVRVARRLATTLGPPIAHLLIRSLHRLIRWRYVNDEVVRDLHRHGRPYVHAFYHDQLLMMTYSYLGRPFGRRLAVLSSRHRDGEYISRTLERFGHLMIRGSTGRGGASALKEMARQLREGHDAAFATDGPRGPRDRVQIGVVAAARLGGAPIVPVALALSKKKSSAPGTHSSFRSRWPAAYSCTAPL